MPVIRTVRGDIPQDELGACYPHEHLLGGPPDPQTDPDLVLDNEEAAIQELTWFRQAGGQALVEVSPPDYRRDVPGLHRISAATGVHIVCTSGHHKDRYCASWVHSRSVDELAEHFTREVNQGINGTGIRAGVIKAASSLNQITPNEEKVFRAAARAHHVTGAAIVTHTEAGTMGLEQIELLKSEGVDPRQIIIGHIDRKLEWDYHLRLAHTGVYLSYDQISKEKYAPDSLRVEFILRLAAEGHGQQILLAGDLARRSYWPSYGTGGGPGLTYILWRFVPWLRAEGLSEAAIEDILIHNPARALTIG
jgi:predicted metal-dependent phosphotriesterase family hydrolase